MGYKILYIEDQQAQSREKDLIDIGFDVETYDPSSDLNKVMSKIDNEIIAVILDYRLTKGDNRVCFDAPTIASTLRSKHSADFYERPIILMSNEDVIIYYYKDFRNQDLFDFAITKKWFLHNKEKFKANLISFVSAYNTIKENNFNLLKILGIKDTENSLIHPHVISKLNSKTGYVYEHSRLIYDTIISSNGMLINEDVLSSRLGISKKSEDWKSLLDSLSDAYYSGVFSDNNKRWWMVRINFWWENVIQSEIPLRRLNAIDRLELIKNKLSLKELKPVLKTIHSKSDNFWTVCQYSHDPIDPFDGIELFKNDYLPWQEKEYISIDTALEKMELFKDFISEIDKKAIRELAAKLKGNG